MKKILFICIAILLMLASACGNVEKTSNTSNESPPQTMNNSLSETTNDPTTEMDTSIMPENKSEYCSQEYTHVDNETGKYLDGTWKVEKLLGFSRSYNDASEYPTGQKFIGDEIIIKKDFFSTKGLTKYKDYQYELKKPVYEITETCSNSDSFYRLYKTDIPDLKDKDVVKVVQVNDPSTKASIPVSITFFVVNNERLILLSEATIFELKKVKEKID